MSRTSMKCVTAFATALMFVIASALASDAAGLDARISASQIATGDSFQLSLSADTKALTQAPDISPLNTDFDILGTSRTSQTQIINGVRSDRQEWIITLAPTSMGVLTIPALSAGTATSAPPDNQGDGRIQDAGPANRRWSDDNCGNCRRVTLCPTGDSGNGARDNRARLSWWRDQGAAKQRLYFDAVGR